MCIIFSQAVCAFQLIVCMAKKTHALRILSSQQGGPSDSCSDIDFKLLEAVVNKKEKLLRSWNVNRDILDSKPSKVQRICSKESQESISDQSNFSYCIQTSKQHNQSYSCGGKKKISPTTGKGLPW